MKDNKPKTFSVNGKDDSLWGPTRGKFVINSITLNYVDDHKNPTHAEIRMYGKKTQWWNYTDSGIENGVNQKDILDFCISLLPNNRDKKWKLSWSEQGMQPNGGWSFDFFIEDVL